MINLTTFQQLRHLSANVRIYCGKNIKGRSFEMFIVSSGNSVEKLQKAAKQLRQSTVSGL